MKKLHVTGLICLFVVMSLLALVTVKLTRENDEGLASLQQTPFYTFKTCERHLGVLLYLFGEDPGVWPEHEHYPIPGEDDYHAMFDSGWGQTERDFLIYDHSPKQELVWDECHRMKGVTHHVHSSDPELMEKQHQLPEAPEGQESYFPTDDRTDSVGLIGPDFGGLEPLTAEQKALLHLQLNLLERRIQLLREVLDLLDEEPVVVPQEEPALFPWLEERKLEA